MNILFTVCGRAGSKGIKNKNFRDFLGIPLIFYTISAIDLYMKENFANEVDIALNTDSLRLIELIKEKVAMQVFIVKRKDKLALDYSPKIATIADTMEIMENNLNKKYDIVVDLDITAPLRTVQDIQNLINKKISSKKDIVFSVTESRRNPYFNMVQLKNGKIELVVKEKFVARQQAPIVYDMNASLYAYEPQILRSGKMLFDAECGIIKMLDTGILDLDCENDFELMQIIAKYLFEKDERFGAIRNNLKNILRDQV